MLSSVDQCRWSQFVAVASIPYRHGHFPVATASQNNLTPHITKTHLPIVSLNILELELNSSSKD